MAAVNMYFFFHIEKIGSRDETRAVGNDVGTESRSRRPHLHTRKHIIRNDTYSCSSSTRTEAAIKLYIIS